MLIITTIENRIIEIPHYLRQPTLDGCGGVGVSTRDCGSLSPGSIPGHGPISHLTRSCRLSGPSFLLWFQGKNDLIHQLQQSMVLD